MANKNNGIMVIRKVTTSSEHTRALERIDELMDIAEDDPRIYELMYLSNIVADYEDAIYPIPETTPADIIWFMMKQKNIKQKDLIPILGSEGMVSMVLNGKRALTVEKMVRLSKFLGVPIGLLAEGHSVYSSGQSGDVSAMVAESDDHIETEERQS
jgi:HTH-type transcriptional regulator / antitoxin HigA